MIELVLLVLAICLLLLVLIFWSSRELLSQRLKFISKFCIYGLLILFSIKLPWLVYFLPATQHPLSEEAKSDLLERRSYLVGRVSSPQFGEALMPSFLSTHLQKEWAIGTLSMAAAALISLAYEFPETRKESMEITGRLIERMLESDMRSYELSFWDKDAIEALDSSRGQIGFLGHLNFMLGAYRLLGGSSKYDELARNITAALVRRMEASPSYYLETFPGQIFVPDNMVVVASIANARLAFGLDNSEILAKWLLYTKEHLLDVETGLVLNMVDLEGRPYGGARGSYSSWNAYYLPFVDSEFAESQFALIEEHFVSRLPLALQRFANILKG